MNSIDQEIFHLFKTLDNTEKKAFVATVAAMVAGAGPLQAMAAGNVVLIGEGHEPVSLSALNDRLKNGYGEGEV